MASSPWPVIAAERAALVEDLRGLSPQAWTTPSLCGGWSVRDVLGHLTASARMSPASFLVNMARTGFRFDAMTAAGVRRETAGTTDDQLAAYQGLATSTSAPPGPVDTWLGEIVIHGADIRRPLGIAHAVPTDAVVRVADFYKGSNLIVGAKRRIEGLTLSATDASWSTGDGLEVTGPILSLVLAMTGRHAALADLDGPGVATLRGRR